MYSRGGIRRGRGIRRGGGVRLASPSPSPSPPSASDPSPTLWTSPGFTNTPARDNQQAGQQEQSGGPLSSEIQPPELTPMAFNPLPAMSGQVYHRRTEGPIVGTPSTAEQSNNEGMEHDPSDERKLIGPYGDSFTDAIPVVRALNKIVNDHWRGPYTTYSSAPEDVKNLWWNEFGRRFRWAAEDDNEIRRIFNKKVGDHMRNVMNKAKTSEAKPAYISSDVWMEMMSVWGTDSHRQASERNKLNRASSSHEGSATYAEGSINIGEHSRRMAKELGREPTFSQTFERAFMKKDKTYVNSRARAAKEKFDEIITASSTSGGDGDGAGTSVGSVDEAALWVEASGGVRRGKVYGMGSLSRECCRKVAASSSSSVSGSRRSRQEAEMEQKMQRMQEELDRKDAKILNLERTMARILRHLDIEQDEDLHGPPTNADGNEDDDAEMAGAEDDLGDEIATPESRLR